MRVCVCVSVCQPLAEGLRIRRDVCGFAGWVDDDKAKGVRCNGGFEEAGVQAPLRWA